MRDTFEPPPNPDYGATLIAQFQKDPRLQRIRLRFREEVPAGDLFIKRQGMAEVRIGLEDSDLACAALWPQVDRRFAAAALVVSEGDGLVIERAGADSRRRRVQEFQKKIDPSCHLRRYADGIIEIRHSSPAPSTRKYHRRKAKRLYA